MKFWDINLTASYPNDSFENYLLSLQLQKLNGLRINNHFLLINFLLSMKNWLNIFIIVIGNNIVVNQDDITPLANFGRELTTIENLLFN